MSGPPRVPNLYAALGGDVSSLRPPPPARKRPSRPGAATEAQIQAAVLKALRLHPAVAWIGRYNSGGFYDGGDRYVQFHSVPGQSDLMGMLKGGRLLAIEIKRPGARPTEQQAAFLARVATGGGLAGVATGVADALALLAGGRAP